MSLFEVKPYDREVYEKELRIFCRRRSWTCIRTSI